jgi:hypothetical protein
LGNVRGVTSAWGLIYSRFVHSVLLGTADWQEKESGLVDFPSGENYDPGLRTD